MAVSTILGSLPLADGDQVKNQQIFNEYYPGYGFFGTLSIFTTYESYAVKLSEAATLHTSGLPVILPKVIELSDGWTWIPCPYPTSVVVAVGLPSVTYEQGDSVKSQREFAEFYSGYGWFGSLSMLDPGQGYRLKVAQGGMAVFQDVR